MTPDQPGSAPRARRESPALSGLRRWGWKRWSLAAAATVFLPKCALCLLGYVAVAAGLAANAPEMCAGSTDAAGATAWLDAAGIAAGCALAGVFVVAVHRRSPGNKGAER